ncbi:MAG: HD-GYP domain-containing protein [Gammaproteobacteria bacterium]|nr:HD-GYP domain-containing protein [Gammaproteobacteria bacterium]
MIIEQEISEITIGAYVVDIVQQRGQHTLANSGWVNTESIIQSLLLKGIQRVRIDTSKQRPPALSIDEPLTFNQQVTKGKVIFEQSKVILRKLFEDLRAGILLELAPIKEITNESIDVIFEYPDALAFVINLRKKDDYLLEHSVAVSILITIFARYLHLNKETTKELAIGAFLHDVGKLKMPDSILNKSGKLTASEYNIVKTHVYESIDSLCETTDIADLSLEVVALHHETLNGTGYPKGLSAVNISIYGRMIAICDIFDALTASRCYKGSYPHVKAFRILRELAQDGQLDAQLVDSFIKCMGVYPVGSIVKLNSNRLAIVTSRNQHQSIKPNVRVFYNLDNNSFEVAQCIDLSISGQPKIVRSVKVDDYNLNMQQVVKFLETSY